MAASPIAGDRATEMEISAARIVRIRTIPLNYQTIRVPVSTGFAHVGLGYRAIVDMGDNLDGVVGETAVKVGPR